MWTLPYDFHRSVVVVLYEGRWSHCVCWDKITGRTSLAYIVAVVYGMFGFYRLSTIHVTFPMVVLTYISLSSAQSILFLYILANIFISTH